MTLSLETAKPAPVGAGRVLGIGLSGALLAVTTILTAQSIELGIDYVYYADVGRRFLETGVYYLPFQFVPHELTLMNEVLYPPSALPLFIYAAFAEPVWWVWWVVPLGVTAWVIHGWQPRWWAVAVMLLLLSWPRAHAAILFGNTDMWAMAAVAAGLRWGWPAVFLTLKPTFAPLALIGVRHRSWWFAAAGLAILVILTLPMWLDYVTVMRNVSNLGSDYSLGSLPLLAVPVVAWATRAGSREGWSWWPLARRTAPGPGRLPSEP